MIQVQRHLSEVGIFQPLVYQSFTICLVQSLQISSQFLGALLRQARKMLNKY